MNDDDTDNGNESATQKPIWKIAKHMIQVAETRRQYSGHLPHTTNKRILTKHTPRKGNKLIFYNFTWFFCTIFFAFAVMVF